MVVPQIWSTEKNYTLFFFIHFSVLNKIIHMSIRVVKRQEKKELEISGFSGFAMGIERS